MRNPSLPATHFDNVRVCSYCDRQLTCEGWASNVGGHAATLCSPNCKELYERATARQGVLPLKGWDVT